MGQCPSFVKPRPDRDANGSTYRPIAEGSGTCSGYECKQSKGGILTRRKRLFPSRKKLYEDTVQSRDGRTAVANANGSHRESKGIRHRKNLGKNPVTRNETRSARDMGLSGSKKVAEGATGSWMPSPDVVLNGGIPGTYTYRPSVSDVELEADPLVFFGSVSEGAETETCSASQECYERHEYMATEEQVISESAKRAAAVTSLTIPGVAENTRQPSPNTESIKSICTVTQKHALDVESEPWRLSDGLMDDAVGAKSGSFVTSCEDTVSVERQVLAYEEVADRLVDNILIDSALRSLQAVESPGIRSCTACNISFRCHKKPDHMRASDIPDCIARLAETQAKLILSDVVDCMRVFCKNPSSLEMYASYLSDSLIQSSIQNRRTPSVTVHAAGNMAGSFCEQLMRHMCLKLKRNNEDELNNNLHTECEERTSVDSGIDERRLDSGIYEGRYDVYLSTDSAISLTGDSVCLRSSCKPSMRFCGDIPMVGFARNLANSLADEEDVIPDYIESDEEPCDEQMNELAVNFELEQRKILARANDSVKESKSMQNYAGVCSLSKQMHPPNKADTTKLKSDRLLSTLTHDLLQDFLDDEKFVKHDSDKFSPSHDEGDRTSIQAKVKLLERKLDLVADSQSAFDVCQYDMNDVRRGSLSGLSSTGRTMSGRGHKLRTPVVIDLGCGVIKAGMAGQRAPQCYCPSVIGVPRRFSHEATKMTKAFYVGDEAWTLAGMLQISYPIKPNIAIWSDVSSFLEHFMEHELGVSDGEHPVLLTELARAPARQRERLTEIMFERFGVPGFYLANQGTLALNSMGLSSGLCLNLGFSCTQAIPVYENHVIDHAVATLDVGGDHVTEYLGRLLLGNQGLSFSTSSEKLLLNQIKERLGYVAKDPLKEQESYKLKSVLHETYTMPDGQEIPIGTERFLAGEILFDPKRLGLNQLNVAEMVLQSKSILDEDLHDVMSDNVLVTGGCSRLRGFGERLQQELSLLTTGSSPMKLHYADSPSMAAWIGGSVLASIPSFESQWMSMESYVEHGSKLVRKVCF